MVEKFNSKKDLKFLDSLNEIKNYHSEIINNHFLNLEFINNDNNINIKSCLLTPNQVYEFSIKNKIINFDKLKKVDEK